MTTTVSSYVFTCDGPAADAHHEYLAEICDPQTTSLLRRLPLRGKCCFEVGAGAGSIALWLATQVGAGGCVWATDLNPRPMREHTALTVVRHDIAAEPVPQPGPLPGSGSGPGWDLIHARLLLQHLPQRREVVERLVAALAPHGWLVVEDWDMTWRHGRVLNAPDLAAVDLFDRYQDTLWHVFAEAGVDHGWASRAAAAMVESGLEDVCAHVHCRSWTGGTAGTRLVAGGITQLADRLCEHGLSIQDLERMRELMADPAMIIRTPPMVSTIGRKPDRSPS